ncbi:PucR family transcriptional regulator [Ornithinimicrobium avium]|uniref:PucR family transcriptional regulator n=1 Tax=Ornithinimicrobium avium TaxID=2283195 RepID=A0A345NP96_9MICO|nr:PucR family transcriptional regulator [Ornithinimicrobium avium]AXH96854.1 PucR family transcriptional regulator [Ornithinimicrobium avium]
MERQVLPTEQSSAPAAPEPSRRDTGLDPTPTGITVREALALDVLAGATVLAGAQGLDRLVTRVNVMEVPDVLPWVRPDELLLTTGYPLRQHGDLVAWVRALDARGLAGVAVKLHRYVDRLPPEALAEADRLGLPVLALPEELGFDDVMNTVLTLVLNRRAVTLARAEQVLDDLVGVVISGGDLDRVCEGMVRHLAEAALVTSMDGRVLARAAASEEVLQAVLALPCFDPTGRFLVEEEVPGVSVEHEDLHRMVARIPGGASDLGRLVLVRSSRFAAEDRHVVVPATTAAALAITKQQAVAAVEARYRADFLRDALLGRAGTPDRVLTHAADLGWDLDQPLAVVVAEVDGPTEHEGLAEPERFRAAWRGAAATDDPTTAVAGFSQEVVLLLGVPAEAEPAQVTERVSAMARQVHGLGGGGRRTFCTGISRTLTDVADLPRAYAEARKAVQVGRRLHGPRATTHFDALGVFRLLSQIEGREEVDSFVAETLGPLAAGGDPDAEDLLHTLTVLLDNNLNVATTARALHFHYNSLRYRIGKLERMLGPFTTDPRLRFAIMLALQVRQLREP